MLKDTFSESEGMVPCCVCCDFSNHVTEWQPFVFAKNIPYMVARLSTLVFMGEEICHDEEWLNVSVNYTKDAFYGARELRLYPAILRHIVHWILPETRRVRKHMSVARTVVQREIRKRELIREGKLPDTNPNRHQDALDWFREVSNGRPFDETRAQIGLSLAAIHTTSNMLTNVMYDLTANPELIQPLRDEIKAVVEEDGGLKKSTMTKMKLLDSVMKESQRVNPTGMGELLSTTSLS